MADNSGALAQKLHKKRARNPSEWKREKRKRLRIAGQEYINNRGELVAARRIGDDCRCRRRCYDRISADSRQELFDGYYVLNSHDEQNAYLYALIRKVDIARKRNKESERRTCTYKYFVRVKGKELQVCRLAFANIHGISPHKIRILCHKLDQNVMYPRDGRGRHDNRPKKVQSDTIEHIKEHIFGILRTDKIRDFLKDEKGGTVDLNITKMWKDYLEINDPNYPNYSVRCLSRKNKTQMTREREVAGTFAHCQDLHQQGTFMQPHHLSSHSNNLMASGNSHIMQQAIPSQQHVVLTPHFLHHDDAVAIEGSLDMQQLGITNISTGERDPIRDSSSDSEDGGVKQPKSSRSRGNVIEPIVKHWLYSKVYHEEFRFQDFLTLRKKICEMRSENNGSLSSTRNSGTESSTNGQLMKTERKQKVPKKLTKASEVGAATYMGGVVVAPQHHPWQQQVAGSSTATTLHPAEPQQQFLFSNLSLLNQVMPNVSTQPQMIVPQTHIQVAPVASTNTIQAIPQNLTPSVINLSTLPVPGVNLVPQSACNYLQPSSFYQ